MFTQKLMIAGKVKGLALNLWLWGPLQIDQDRWSWKQLQWIVALENDDNDVWPYECPQQQVWWLAQGT